MKNLIKLLIIILTLNVYATPLSIPDRSRGDGPFERLILRGVMVVNGEGAPPVGPMDVLIEGNRITRMRNLGLLKPFPEDKRIPVLPGDEIRVEMTYVELLVPEGGIYEFVFPTVVGPRYSNQPEQNRHLTQFHPAHCPRGLLSYYDRKFHGH